MNELERENAKLKRLVSELGLEKLVLKDIASGNLYVPSDGTVRSALRAQRMGSAKGTRGNDPSRSGALYKDIIVCFASGCYCHGTY